MKLMTAVWNGEEAKVRFSNEFENAHWVLQADALQDMIVILEARYEALIASENPLMLEVLGLNTEER
jgi:hypothetical protein